MFGLRGQLAPARLRQRVKLRAAVVFRFTPLRSKPALLFQPVQRREQRSGLDVERASRELRDAPRDAQAVVRPQRQRAQDQQVESPLQEVGFGGDGSLL